MKAGDYVRTNNGLIFKIIGGNEDNWKIDIEYSKLEYIEDTWLELYRYNDNAGWFIPEHCKSSPNIIDLVEVGDYVNGEKVKSVPLTKCVNGCKKDTFRIVNCTDEDIKTIVTKEQFESMEYKL